MANFDTQIQALAGTATQSEMDEWMGEGIKEIINILPPKLKSKCAAMTVLNNATPMDLDGSGEVLFVTRENADSGYHTPCREIDPQYGHLAEDSTNLIYYATATDPAYWIGGSSSGAEADASQLTIFPDPTANQPANVHHIHYATVDASNTAVIANFPDEAEYLVVLYASCKVLQNKMNEKSSNLPTFVAPVSPAPPSQTAFSAYTTGLSESDPGVFSLNAVAPAVPTISTVSYTDYTSNSISVASVIQGADYPTYTSPNVTFEGDTDASLTSDLVEITGGQTGEDDDFEDFNKWFTALGEMIEDDEDIELASAQIEKINAYINAYNVQMQDSLNTFNEATVKFQAVVQKATTDSNYQMQKNLQEAQLLEQQRGQKAVQDLQASIENNNRALAKFQAETGVYTANITKQVQEYTQKLSHYQLELNTRYQAWAKTESDNIQAYQVKVADYSAELNKASQDFTLNLQKHTTDYTWLQGQYTQLKAEYQQGLQILVSGGLQQPQQQA